MLKNIVLERPLAVLDLETTGNQPHVDRIVEISVLKVWPEGRHETRTRRLNPGIPIPAEATAIHGITDADVASEPTFGRIARSLAAYLEGCDLCGYNLWSFDLRLLLHEFRRVGVPFSTEDRYLIDPKRIFHGRERRDLAAALKFYCGKEHAGAHSAEADVLAALLVLDGQADRYDDLPRTIPELHAHMAYPDFADPDGKFRRRDDGVIVFAFGPQRGRSVEEVARTDPGFLEWMLTKDFSDEAKAVVREALEGVRDLQPVLANTA
jgi:DNA polymerase-3 subunit epsilon